ncbi:DNA pilot protein [Apis mellifera associated microvirus 34]|nr:DNA pilot protein [Apis mellifera associated microvirus 34]
MADTGSGNQGGGWFSQIAVPILMTAANAITRGGPKRQWKYNKKAMTYQNELNRANAEWAFEKEMELRKWQTDYDSPKAQMQRFLDAGLNPNLMYDKGTAGEMSVPNVPVPGGVTSHSIDAASLGSLGTEFQQMRLMQAQADLTKVKTEESGVKQDLMKAQKNVVQANPFLNKTYVDAFVTNMKATAEAKAVESSFLAGYMRDADGNVRVAGYLKMEKEIRLLEQKYKLNEADQKIKAKIFESKEFQNELQRIQVEWMKDAEITPQHIYQGIFMILQNLMRK